VFDITFAPTSVNCFSDNVYVLSNDPDSPSINIAVTGCGVIGPDLTYSPGSFEKWLVPGGSASDMLSVNNNGDQQLNYNAQVVYSGDSKDVVTVYPVSVNYSTGTTDGTSKTETSLIKGLDTEDGWFKFDVSSIPEMVVSGETGLLVESGNVPAFTHAVLTLVQDRAQRKRLGQNGRTRLEKNFTQARMLEEIALLVENT